MRLLAAVLLMTAGCAAQAPLPGNADFHGAQSAIEVSRSEFGGECGIQDTSDSAALKFSSEPDGGWSPGGSSRGIGEMARFWHEANYMVDMHGAPGPGMSSMHSGMLCFDAQGRLTRVFDRYMDVVRCGCQRLTTMAYAADGTMTEWAQTYVNVRTGERIKTPADAQEFPEVWEFQRLGELPFSSLLKLNLGQPAEQNEKR